MSNGGKIRVGIDGARELELDVEDIDEAVATLEKGIGGETLIWLTDRQGTRHGIVTERIAFLEVAGASDRAVGFG